MGSGRGGGCCSSPTQIRSLAHTIVIANRSSVTGSLSVAERIVIVVASAPSWHPAGEGLGYAAAQGWPYTCCSMIPCNVLATVSARSVVSSSKP